MADLGDQPGDVLYLLHDIVHRASGGMYLLGTRHHFAGAGVDELADIVGGTGAAAGQMAHFPGDHGKSFPLLARSGRFHGRIQRQDVGLESDVVNQLGDRADTLGAVGNFVHGVHHGLHRVPALGGRIAGGNGELIGIDGGTGVVLHRHCQLIHRLNGLLHVRYRLVGTIVKVIIPLRQLVAAVTHINDLAGDIID